MRLIDADAILKKCFKGGGNDKFTEGYNFAVENITSYIELAPTIDAQPVKHGEWLPAVMDAETKEAAEVLGIDIDTFLSKAAYCSYCGIQQITNGRDRTGMAPIHKAIYRYCPSCGAKMDGGKADG